MIIIDPGHPSKKGDEGVTGKGFREVDFNYQIAIRLIQHIKILQTPWDITRGKDEVMSLPKRRAFAKARGAEIVFSIHANANENRKHKGLLALYSEDIDTSSFFVANAIVNATPIGLRRYGRALFDINKAEWPRVYNVVKGYHCPVVLVECGYVSNPSDLKLLKTEAVKQAIVAALYCGVTRWLESKESK